MPSLYVRRKPAITGSTQRGRSENGSARQHRGQLHHARAVVGIAVLALGEADGLVGRLGHWRCSFLACHRSVPRADTLLRVDERALAERLITYDTSRPTGCGPPRASSRAGSRRATSTSRTRFRRPAGLTAASGRRTRRRVVLHGHLDVVPGRPEQFAPRLEGDRLIGRGAYDMKGALAAMMCALHDVADQTRVRVRFVACPTRSPRTSTPLDRRAGARGASSATSRSPASRPSCTSASRPRACSRAGSRCAAAPPTARRRGSATTRSLKATTCSAESRPCRSVASPPSCSTGRRSTSAGSTAATRSTRSPTSCAHGRRHPLPAQPGSR